MNLELRLVMTAVGCNGTIKLVLEAPVAREQPQ
jgi:hypothetical protein